MEAARSSETLVSSHNTALYLYPGDLQSWQEFSYSLPLPKSFGSDPWVLVHRRLSGRSVNLASQSLSRGEVKSACSVSFPPCGFMAWCIGTESPSSIPFYELFAENAWNEGIRGR